MPEGKFLVPDIKSGQEDIVEIPNKRYARGKISRKEYKQIREI